MLYLSTVVFVSFRTVIDQKISGELIWYGKVSLIYDVYKEGVGADMNFWVILQMIADGFLEGGIFLILWTWTFTKRKPLCSVNSKVFWCSLTTNN